MVLEPPLDVGWERLTVWMVEHSGLADKEGW